MVSFFSNWIEQIVIAVVIVSIFEMILPNGNLKKYVKMVLSIYIVFNIIYPFVDSNALYNFDISKYTENVIPKTNVNQESMDKRLEDLYIQEIENNIKTKVKELGYVAKKCKVEAELSGKSQEDASIKSIDLNLYKYKGDVEKVTINEVQIGNKNQTENKSEEIERIKTELSEFYSVSSDIIHIKLK